ncbi:MAG: efflux RND transporter periplasmic adaptor subunit [Campylobacter sp.]|nr:efflux RND transporter periplasmic adaptor subunit [Campylobacter sp.]
MKYLNLTLAILLATSLVGCGMLDEKEKGDSKQKMGMGGALPVDIFVAKKGDGEMSFEYPARIQSQQDVVLVPKVSGTLLKQNFKPGDKVKAGDVLFMIDPDTYEAAYEVAKANILQANATLKNAKHEADRVNKLYVQKAVSQKDYDNAIANLEGATANLASANANAKTAKLNLDYTKITAPFDGIVSENLVDVGTHVIATSTKLVRLTKLNPIDARFYIADIDSMTMNQNLQDSTWSQVGTQAILTLNSKEFQGKINFIDSSVDTSTGRVLAKAEFANENGELLPGSFARISMNGFVQKDAIIVPLIAILQDTVSPYVYIIEDGKAMKKAVKISYQNMTHAYISQGINENDQIIINNFKKIGTGVPVVVDTKPQTASQSQDKGSK